MVKKILLILFFLFQVSFSYSEKINSCESDFSFKELNKIENLESIIINIPNSKKWNKNIFLILRNNGWIPEKYKKTHRANTIFIFKNGLECNQRAKVKFHGDNPDHLKRVDDFNILSSLNIKLINSNIDNITEFKLFLPETRKRESEIFTTNLLRELGFFAPRTKKIMIKVNGIDQEYLFQEKISKEFIESYGFTEGPIIEGDQRLQKSGQRALQLARIVNKNWVQKNWRNAYIALDSLSRVNELYLKFYSSVDNIVLNEAYPFKGLLNLLELENYESDSYFKNLFYDKLLFSMGGRHALVPDNRTLYFNYIENNFYPIYYDGDMDLSYYENYQKYKSLNKNKPYEYNKILDQLKNLNLNKLGIKNINSGATSYSSDKLEKHISKIIDNYSKELKDILISYYNYNTLESKEIIIDEIKKQNANSYYSRFAGKKIKLIFFNKKPNEFLICNHDISDCNRKNISLDEIGEIVSQRYKNNSEFTYIFVTSDFDKYKNNHFEAYESKWKRIDINENFYAKKTTEGIDLKLDLKNKEIDIEQNNPNGRVIFFTKKEIENWKINFSSKKNFDKKKLLISKNDIDGCITFYNSNFKNLTFLSKEGFCEDSINIIRSEGSIKEININNAYKDGLDMDFSKINIKSINVVNSGNDCVDVSFGNYQVKDFKLVNCFDNGISVGEKSNLVSDNLIIKDSKTGLAVKDSSKVVANFLHSKNNKNCFKIYNKKPEFLGGHLVLENMNCNNNSYNVEYGSRFILKNDI